MKKKRHVTHRLQIFSLEPNMNTESLSYPSGHLGAVPQEKASGADGVHNAMNYLTKILSAKVYDVAVESPLDYASKLSERLGVHIWLKREDLQPVSYMSFLLHQLFCL